MLKLALKNFRIKSRISIEPNAGAFAPAFFEEAAFLATMLNQRVFGYFNDTPFVVAPEEKAPDVFKRWEALREDMQKAAKGE